MLLKEVFSSFFFFYEELAKGIAGHVLARFTPQNGG